MFSNQHSAHTRPPARVTLNAVSDVRVSEGGKAYFVARFKQGVLGKPVSRTFWADQADDGTATWPRASPDDLRALVGADLTGEVEVVAVDIEPEEFVDANGEVHQVSSRSVVRFADETVERATRRSGSRLRQQVAPTPQASLPPSQALAVHGDGYAGGGGVPGVPA